MSSRDEDRWTAWCTDFDEVEREVFALFHTRWMWRAITGLMNNGVPDRQYTIVQNYFVRTYVGTVCTAIRREADNDTRTSSLARCLAVLVECPHFATRARHVDAARQQRDTSGAAIRDDELGVTFHPFAPGGGDHIDPDVAAGALHRLTSAVAPVRKYTNKVLAHRERNGVVEELTPSWSEINHALDEVGRITQQFYALRHPGTQLASVTPVPDLKFISMFRVPWYSEGWEPPADWDL